MDLSGNPSLTRQDPQINFNWGTGSPASNIPSDHFSVRWVRNVFFQSGTYTFNVFSDDGVRVYLKCIDRDGHSLKAAGDVTIQLFDLADDAKENLLARYEFPVADAAWALYQQGNCHYHAADYARADKLYARLAAEFSGSEWVRFADAKIELMSLGAGT